MKTRKNDRFSLREFTVDYDSVYSQADAIFKENNICQWEKNEDAVWSCILNRHNSAKTEKKQDFEKDGCCMNICIYPDDFDDPAMLIKQHSAKKGCRIKSIKCKLHYCTYLRTSKDPVIIESIQKLEILKKYFIAKYKTIWDKVPYGSTKKHWIEKYRSISRASSS